MIEIKFKSKTKTKQQDKKPSYGENLSGLVLQTQYYEIQISIPKANRRWM